MSFVWNWILIYRNWTIECLFCIAINATLRDWLNISRHFPNQSKPKPIMTCSFAFSRAWRRLHAFASSSDWFIRLWMSTSLVIGQNDYFGDGFTTLEWKPFYNSVLDWFVIVAFCYCIFVIVIVIVAFWFVIVAFLSLAPLAATHFSFVMFNSIYS